MYLSLEDQVPIEPVPILDWEEGAPRRPPPPLEGAPVRRAAGGPPGPRPPRLAQNSLNYISIS